MKKIGITGGIASGKSLISRIFEEMGYPVFYSDIVSKRLVNSSEELKSALIDLLGAASYMEGKLNRSYVAKKVFSEPKLLEQVNRAIHPEVREAFTDWCASQVSELVFNEAAILFETGTYVNFDSTILVTAPLETRINRAIIRDKSTHVDVVSRIEQQWSDEKKIPLASYVILNDDETPLIRQVEQVLLSLS